MRIINNVTIHSLVEYRALPKFKLQESTEYNNTKYMYSVGIPKNIINLVCGSSDNASKTFHIMSCGFVENVIIKEGSSIVK